MKITTLNLRHGGASRISALGDWLEGTQSDAIVCTEFRNGASGDQLAKRLGRAGYVHQFSASRARALNTVCIFSRQPAQILPTTLPPEEQHRLVVVRLDGLTLAGTYFSQLKAKLPLFRYLLSRPKELEGTATLMGDFNTGLHHVDEAGATFHCAAEFGRLSDQGWVDAWRLRHGDERAFSWHSNMGNGFRIDHAFVSSDLAGRVVAAEYDQAPRHGLTSHAALTLDLGSE
ncbi:endonuclease/exonuclease/phosphatase family protein [Rubellimicrobium arenae]|uniref:endonuclease/exonuclease/phosphatase family protein n=1 Tax=Rubellimicrobium arenae TaxID=2817372 RepID=UPI001B301747|nr:endonuclease/exonuclease/phosphatase family protein [Rubellimicrobium arenae]